MAVAGAVLPDIPLIAIAIFCALDVGMLPFAPGFSAEFKVAMDSFYFDTPWFVGLHQLLHSPLSLLGLYLVLSACTTRDSVARFAGSWFLAGSASHSAVDLLTHSKDGILVFWPFNWDYRFDAGVSQWDMGGAGATLITIETAMLVSALAATLWMALKPFWMFLSFKFSDPSTTAARAAAHAGLTRRNLQAGPIWPDHMA